MEADGQRGHWPHSVNCWKKEFLARDIDGSWKVQQKVLDLGSKTGRLGSPADSEKPERLKGLQLSLKKNTHFETL